MTEPTRALAEFAADFRAADIPPAVRDQAKIAIADAMGTVLAGINEESVRHVRDWALRETRPGRASVLGTGSKLAATGAALANGAAAHALDYDNISLTVSGFIASPVLFAALAVAEEEGVVPGEKLLDAFIIGWESEAAIARGLGVHHYAKGWHSTATLGHFGAAIGTARLLGLNAVQMQSVIGTAASEASGMRTMIGNMLNPFHVGKAARNGITAARLVQQGFLAHESVLETAWGFCEVFNGAGNFDLAAISNGLGSRFDLTDPGLVVKVHPCCGLIHSSLDAVLDLIDVHDFDWRAVTHVRVSVHELVPKTMRFDDPRSGYEAKFSTPFCIASALHEGSVSLAHFTDERTRDGDIRGLMSRVEMVVHPDLHGYDTFLEKEFSEVAISLADGRTLTKRIQRISNKGSRGRPVSMDDIAAKFADCARDYPDRPAADAALAKLRILDQIGDIREITACLC